MHEATLRDFFVGTVPADELARDLEGAIVRDEPWASPRVSRLYSTPMDEEFTLEAVHLVRLCDAVLAGTVPAEALEAVGFCVIASDMFEVDDKIKEAEVIRETLHDWATPEINYPLNLKNVASFRARLLGQECSFELSLLNGRGNP